MHAFYGDNSQELILLIAWLPAAVSFIFLRTIRLVKIVRQANEHKMFYNFLYISLCLAGFLMALIISQNSLRFNRIEYIMSAFVVLILLFLPVALSIKQEFLLWKKKEESPVTIVTDQNPPNPVQDHQNSCFQNIFKPPNRGEDYTILQALFSLDMLILFISTTFGVGGTLTAIDNLGQIGHRRQEMVMFN